MVAVINKNSGITIDALASERFDDFLEFRQKRYPLRSNLRQLLKLQVLDYPNYKDKLNLSIFVAYDNEEKIIGELACTPRQYYLNNKRQNGYFYHDFYVLKKHRNKGIGISLLSYATERCLPGFVIGVSKDSVKLFKNFNFETIEDLHKYIWLKDIKALIKPLLFGLSINPNNAEKQKLDFPHYLNSKEYNYRLSNPPEGQRIDSSFINRFEFERSIDYLNWRLKLIPGGYFYLLNDSRFVAYFIVKQSCWRGLSMLEIVDYRFPPENTLIFKSMLSALKRFVKSTNIDGIIAMSSYKVIDKLLSENMFLRVGKPIKILTNDIELSQKAKSKRDLMFITQFDK